ncbi:sn-glycerol-1-phosphate dehydrogenase [Clostridium psychrophilum]|uniref:sn-glycerol-1-phosphate dehydrogenase n=1 Tax=Clostridium psychrophilum TaxID=132926 RepID=UPI001C0DE39E|nr:sn-glycerol-1-phosphate dehydrogenase [Clostridium psychrophilum]MBU3179810.1 sn-glycerol-1-phosphate dehydrogenase [Clostridium psychrophilum]
MKLTVQNVGNLKINDFLKGTLDCECGKPHSISLKKVLIKKDAIEKLPEILAELGYKKVLVIADTNTNKVAGNKVEEILTKQNVNFKKYVYHVEDTDLIPNEESIGKLMIQVEKDTDIIVTVGSGTLNDLAKFVSYRLEIACMIVATAPSMDGFASDSSALILNNLKTTCVSNCDVAIIGDINILKEAPMKMILAGLGDILGKYSALNDWKISQIINDEYLCEVAYKMASDSLNKCIENVEGIKNREDIAMEALMEALIGAGIAMSYVGKTRPASGSEHHLAHYWEMMFAFDGKTALLHGTKVGIATVVTAKLRELFLNSNVNFEVAIFKANKFDQKEWKANVEKLFKKAATGIITLNEKDNLNSIEDKIKRINIINEKFDEIISVIKQMPTAKEIESILIAAGAPYNPKQVGIDEKDLVNAVLNAKEIRTRYTILNLLWDLGLLEDSAYKVRDFVRKEKIEV